jgi:hypothetical protein
MNSLIVYCVVTAAASTLILGVLAGVWAKSPSPYRFVLSIVVVWAVISTLPLSDRSWEVARFAADSAHFVATLIWAGPFVVAGVIALVSLVKIGASRKLILLASLGASAVAAPVSLLSGLYAACSLGDCL